MTTTYRSATALVVRRAVRSRSTGMLAILAAVLTFTFSGGGGSTAWATTGKPPPVSNDAPPGWRYRSVVNPCAAFAVVPLEHRFGPADVQGYASDDQSTQCAVGVGAGGTAKLMIEVDGHVDTYFRSLKAAAESDGPLYPVVTGCQAAFGHSDSLLGPRVVCLDGNLCLVVAWIPGASPSAPGHREDQTVVDALGQTAEEVLRALRTR
ncbi:hypothetical protein ACIOBK_33675 [Micromonospora chokoriensis]